MTNVILIGANGATMRVLTDQLKDNFDVHLTLFLRNASRIDTRNIKAPVSIFEGDATSQTDLDDTFVDQDIVVVGLGGPLASFVEPIVSAMHKNHVSRLIFILGLGIYDEVPGKFGEWNASFGLTDFKEAARLIETSDINYTILRPAWMSNRPEINYETTVKGETFRGTVITRASIADYIIKLINQPDLANRGSIGLSEPGTDGDSPYPFMQEGMNMHTLNEQINQLTELINSHHHIVALTGAGISTSAGINDLMHTSHATSALISSKANLKARPEEFYQAMHKNFLGPIFQNGPTIAHKALAKLEQTGHLDAVVTTNVDYLHELAGNNKVADIWYSFNDNHCIENGHQYDINTLNQGGVPYCPVDGSLISPGPTYHHIGTSQNAIQNAMQWMDQADMVLVIGSNGYYDRVNTQVPLVQINPAATEFDRQATLNIHATADEVLKNFA